ncbi:FxLYD domain-containing protein [Streptomyces anulatus]|uniref:FxLYD domain-containing protein n=1 Tax=Streptomyces anulatus TaxID=1892 RepID=UPI003865B870|nr:FxLYD domain-containing protein [Streptomyces anulatus]
MSDYFPPPPPEQPQPEHRAPASASPPSPWAAPAAPPGRQRTGLIVTLAVGGGLVVAGAMVALVYSLMDSVSDSIALPPERSDAPYSEPYEEEPYEEEPVEPVAPGPSAEGDVTITKCTRDSLIFWPHADLRIVNKSGSPAAYIVSITFVDADGAVVSDGIATTEEVAPGASVKVRAQGSGEAAAGTKCRIAEVDRHAL